MSWKNPRWTEQELQILKENYSDKDPKDLSGLLKGRTWRSIKLQAFRSGMRRKTFASNPHKSKLLDGFATQFEIGYVSGLIDGEGSVGFSRGASKNYIRFCPRINIFNTDMKLMKKARDIVGGKIIEIQKQKPHFKIPYKIEIRQSDAVLRTLEILLPHLTTKAEQSKLIIEFIKSRQSRSLKTIYTQRERTIIKRVYELNKKSKGGKW